MTLRGDIIRLAYEKPELRDRLLPLVRTAADLCKEVPELCSRNLGIPRSKMPQVFDSFLDHVRELGYRVRKEKVDPHDLHATQKEIAVAMVEKILRTFRSGSFDPTKGLIVSKDDYVLNGHHRWAAVLLNNNRYGEDVRLEINRVDAPIRVLLELAGDFDGSEYRAFGEFNR